MRKKHAILSPDRVYCYTLERTWDCRKARVLFIMLNPSDADENIDDRTVIRCGQFADRWGYGGIVVGNLFAYRSPNPGALLHHHDPVGPDNDYHLRRLAKECETVIVAWGNSPGNFPRFQERQAVLKELLKGRMQCLGTNQSGTPKHPLALGQHRIPDDAKPRPFH